MKPTRDMLWSGEAFIGDDGRLYETLESYGKKCVKLTKMVQKAVLLEQIPMPDVAITVPRGGLMVTEFLARGLKMDASQVVNHPKSAYKGGEQNTGVYSSGQTATPELVEGKVLLIGEDVADTGGTRIELIDGLEQMNPALIIFTSVYWKRKSQKPDFYVAVTDDPEQWIEFPTAPLDVAGENFRELMRLPLEARAAYYVAEAHLNS